MSKELRTQFEKELQIFLKDKLKSYLYIKVNRNKIILDNKKGSKAVILLTYQNASHTYVFYMNVYSTEITNFIDSIQPPYSSNFDNKDIVYNSYYLSEKKSDPILLPITEKGKEYTFDRILNILNTIYLERAYNLIEVNKKLIKDIMYKPHAYAYPFLISLYAIQKNKISYQDIDLEYLLSEEMLGYINDKDLKIAFNKEIIDYPLYNIPMLLTKNKSKKWQDDVIETATALFGFLKKQKLLIDVEPFDEEGKLKIDTVIKRENVTPEGLALFNTAVEGWLKYLNRSQAANKYENLSRLGNGLAQIRESKK
ncbi:hypothetical protein J3U57_06760 [Gilliamella sp. B3464]|uniref:hypothetical protein n=1 Tax=unclassified Gilliamella TaxID=2685620 RepID=UPI00226A5B3B|nr:MULTISPECIES: hypothetical protein [unclassified Gilliamella]MCX8712188.1 hypothetical protein [Gilliamella sp. B3468]MCX8751267.1 hypothetical protein [Gilliamella sp. B3464]